ncbi:uncharacterized protein EV420DRAFT_1652364 [Desarmillaria tabescens]|uniref:Uncharacterized protein n=1 Tax=Armillaria tabescens TaxID=1929756 RepID=A0AA39J7V3_ARMTA|nr:uncharacterized protein EV420DRAFT_1652364 [Desarmillaria tabescens]KAK0436826.1 hypothetical protein EV420DRAFT_1652364 [Desarmillaria tabescens]
MTQRRRSLSDSDLSPQKRAKVSDTNQLTGTVSEHFQKLLNEAGSQPTLGLLGIIRQILSEETINVEARENRDEVLKSLEASLEQPKVPSASFSTVTREALQDLGVRFNEPTDWTPQGIFDTMKKSEFNSHNLEPLYQQLEAIYRSSGSKNEAAARLIINAYIQFITTTVTEMRKTKTTAFIKSEIEAGIDIATLVPPDVFNDDASVKPEAISEFLETPDGKNVPVGSTFEDFRIEDRADFVWFCNKNMRDTKLPTLGGAKDQYQLRLFPEFAIGPDTGVSKGATLLDKNGRPFRLSGVSDYGIWLFKTEHEVPILSSDQLKFLSALAQTQEGRLVVLEAKSLNSKGSLEGEALTEATAQALALSHLSNSIRFIVTDSERWLLAHLHNGKLPGQSSEITHMPYFSELDVPNPFLSLYGTLVARDKAVKEWRSRVKKIYVLLMEWLLPGTGTTGITSPSPSNPPSASNSLDRIVESSKSA